MIVIAILFIIMVIGPIAGFWPPVRQGSTSNNNILFVTMHPPAWYPPTGQTYHAVLAQEVAEWWLRWAVALPIAAAAMLLIDAGPYEPFVAILLALAATVWTALFYGQLDLIGRAVEVLADGRRGYLEQEAARLQTHGRGNFKHKTVAECAALIKARFPIARVLLALLKRRIARG